MIEFSFISKKQHHFSLASQHVVIWKIVAFSTGCFSHVRRVFPLQVFYTFHTAAAWPGDLYYHGQRGWKGHVLAYGVRAAVPRRSEVAMITASILVHVTISQMNGPTCFLKVLGNAWSRLPCKVWLAWSSNYFPCIICFENVQPSVWPSSYSACPLRNLPNPFPRISADWSPGRVAFNAALAACGKGWRQGLQILETMRRPIPRAWVLWCVVGAVARVWQSLLMCWRAPKQFDWMHVLLHYIWD